MIGVLVGCSSCVVSIDLDQDDMRGIGAIAQSIESYDARLVATRCGILLGRSEEGAQLFGHDRNVYMDDEQAVRHEPTLLPRIA
jgi:hypothetical protein